MNYYALGNKFENKGLKVMYDFKYSYEGIDRKGIVTGFVENNDKFRAQDVAYLENWLRVECGCGVNHLRTSYGFIPSVQYLSFKDMNIRFFVSYVGRYYNYSSYAKDNLGLENYNTGRLSVGFIAPLLIL